MTARKNCYVELYNFFYLYSYLILILSYLASTGEALASVAEAVNREFKT